MCTLTRQQYDCHYDREISCDIVRTTAHDILASSYGEIITRLSSIFIKLNSDSGLAFCLNYRRLTEMNSRYYGLSLLRTPKARPNGCNMLMQHRQSNIVESNTLNSFGHRVARCCMMLIEV